MINNMPRLLFAMMTTAPDRPWCLDLFCGAGGAAMGYKLAGFNVLGVDIKPQPRYPGWFVQANALDFARQYGHLFDLIHASPVCKKYSRTTTQWRGCGYKYPDQITETRAVLHAIGKPYIIENVPDAASELWNPVELCGSMFDLYTTRHRLFETSPRVTVDHQCNHRFPQCKMGRKPKRYQEYIQIMGNFSDVDYGRIAMETPWMCQQDMNQAIPPAYTRYIGEQMMRVVMRKREEHIA